MTTACALITFDYYKPKAVFSYLPGHSRSPLLFPYTTLFRSVAGKLDAGTGDSVARSEILARQGTGASAKRASISRSEAHTSELQPRPHLVCRPLLSKKRTSRRASL